MESDLPFPPLYSQASNRPPEIDLSVDIGFSDVPLFTCFSYIINVWQGYKGPAWLEILKNVFSKGSFTLRLTLSCRKFLTSANIVVYG